jgi:hypothetical protein
MELNDQYQQMALEIPLKGKEKVLLYTIRVG